MATTSSIELARPLEVVLLVAMVVTAIVGVIAPLVGPAGFDIGTGAFFGTPPTVDVTLDPAAVTITTDPSLPSLGGTVVEPGQGIEFLTPTGTQIAVSSPDLVQRLAFTALPVLGALLAIAVMGILWRIVRTLRDGDPFVEANARRLYVIAFVVGIGGQLVVFLDGIGRFAILTNPAVEPYVVLDMSMSFLPVVAGLAIVVLAEVFRRGAALRADVEGLV